MFDFEGRARARRAIAHVPHTYLNTARNHSRQPHTRARILRKDGAGQKLDTSDWQSSGPKRLGASLAVRHPFIQWCVYDENWLHLNPVNPMCEDIVW